jgi:hypothetical protein
MRTLTAYLIAPIMKITGFRFGKSYRHGASAYHRAVYAMLNTVTANHIAGLPPASWDTIRADLD